MLIRSNKRGGVGEGARLYWKIRAKKDTTVDKRLHKARGVLYGDSANPLIVQKRKVICE